MKKYKLAVFIGRFQPYHIGHHSVITNALNLAESVLVLVGSSGGPRTHRNPFTYTERVEMISDSFNRADWRRILFSPLVDHLYNDEQWMEDVQREVYKCGVANKDVCLVGHSKDQSSYYLKLFPQWHSEDCGNINNLSSTHIRELYFVNGEIDFTHVTPKTYEFLQNFAYEEVESFGKIKEEFRFVTEYKKQWAVAPYPPTFVTVDAVVVQSGHLLLVKRKAFPGNGLWALPGGFVGETEKLQDGMIRELKEETGIKVPVPVLVGSIAAQKVFDDPYRSSRGRTITHAFLIHLNPDALPKVKGSDDAEKAKWFPLSEISREMMFEDHYSIIENMIGLL